MSLSSGMLTVTVGGTEVFSGPGDANHTIYAPRPDYTVTDATGTGHGWNVTLQATPVSCVVGVDEGCTQAFETLPAGSLEIAPPHVACAADSQCRGMPSVTLQSNAAVDVSSPVTVLSAAVNQGMGSYTVAPGSIGPGQLALHLPANAPATTYHSTLIITVNSGP